MKIKKYIQKVNVSNRKREEVRKREKESVKVTKEKREKRVERVKKNEREKEGGERKR